MRSNSDFIEVTGLTGGKKILVNKSAIIFVTQGETEEHAVIMTHSGDRMNKIITKESYKDVTEEILWNGWYKSTLDYYSRVMDVGLKAPEEETNG